MGEIVNLRRVRKAKQRADAAIQADGHRLKHGIPKRERDLAKARGDKQLHDVDAHRLKDRDA